MYTVQELLEKINSYIQQQPIVRPPEGLYKPIEYILSLGGKRIRPVLTLMAYNLYKDDVSEACSPATALEIFHNYTLLHDDLMDNSDMRRGKPTVHKVWDDNTAILSGDAMLVLAYQYIAATPSEYLKEVLELFNTTALEICAGQQYDMEFEKREDVSAEEYLEMIRLKTAVLLAASLKIGAILGGASEKDAGLLYHFGIQIGIAFQLKDDYLDVYGNPEVFGKNIGDDILCNKKTYILIKAKEKANNLQLNELHKWINAVIFEPREKIEAVKAIYDQVGIKAISEQKMNEYFDSAMETLSKVSVEEDKKKELKNLVEYLMYREV